MKRFLAVLLIALLLVIPMAGCDKAEPTTATAAPSAAPAATTAQPTASAGQTAGNIVKSKPEGESWTVFVYLCGTDLESNGGMATVNLQEMLDVTKSDNVKIVVQTGGAKAWKNDIVQPDQLGRYEIADGKMTLVDKQPSASMGSADTLGDFLSWGVAQYPADKTMCLLWNHGGGSAAGVAFDEMYDMDSLDVSELAKGIAKAGVEFEVIGFDTCLMATLETASALSPYGRYMVASEEIEPGTGWDYTAWLQALCDNPKADGLSVGKAICDSYFAKCQAGQTQEMATLSVIDLANVPKLVNSFDQMATELKEIVAEPSKYQPFARAMTKAESFGGNNDKEGYTNMVDLGDLVAQSKTAFPNSGAAVLADLGTAVKYKVNGAGREKSSGLSVFVPLSVSADTLDLYAKTAAVSSNYLRYMESLYEWKMPSGVEITLPVVTGEDVTTQTVDPADTTAAAALDPEKYPLSFHTELDNNGSYQLKFDSGEDIVKTVAFNLYFESDDGKSMLFLGTDYDINYDEATGIYSDNFRNVWPAINGETCSMMPLDWGEDYILYTVPIKLNGAETNLRMLYDYKTNAYRVLGTWDGIEQSGMSSKEIRPLAEGDKVQFLFTAQDFGAKEPYTFDFGGFTVQGPVTVEEAQLFDAKYYYEYEITDIFGRVYTSKMAVITSKGGEITIEKLEEDAAGN